jgi:hypothetical protein
MTMLTQPSATSNLIFTQKFLPPSPLSFLPTPPNADRINLQASVSLLIQPMATSDMVLDFFLISNLVRFLFQEVDFWVFADLPGVGNSGAEPAHPSWGGQIEKKKKHFGEAKIRKNNKIWGKILIFFLGEPWGLGGPRPPQAP